MADHNFYHLVCVFSLSPRSTRILHGRMGRDGRISKGSVLSFGRFKNSVAERVEIVVVCSGAVVSSLVSVRVPCPDTLGPRLY